MLLPLSVAGRQFTSFTFDNVVSVYFNSIKLDNYSLLKYQSSEYRPPKSTEREIRMKIKKFLHFLGIIAVTLLFCSSVVLFAQAAISQIKTPANLDEALDINTYARYLSIGKNWLVTYGPSILIALFILVTGRWLALHFSNISVKAMTRGKVDKTLATFLGKLLYYTLLAFVVISAANQVGINTTSFIAIFGAVTLAVSMALRSSIGNFASGVLLIIFRPFKVGDYVMISGVTGKVQQIDIFGTLLLTPDNQRIIIPNGKVTAGIINNISAEPKRRIDLVIGIGYDDDIGKAKATLAEILKADKRILTSPAPTIAVSDLADSSINLVVRPWVRTGEYGAVRFDLLEKIKLTFDEKGISFPYPQQEVYIHQQKAVEA